jgi:hypothetical protein
MARGTVVPGALGRPNAFLPHCAEAPQQGLVETRFEDSIRRHRMSEQGREDQIITFPESDGEGTDGQGSPGIIEEKNREAEAAEHEGSTFDLEGDDTDGEGSTGILEEQVRAAREREAGTARKGTEGFDTDGAGSGGILDEK